MKRTAAPVQVASDEEVAQAKATLIHQVDRRWRAEPAVPALSDPRPIPISWRLTEQEGLMDHDHLVGGGETTLTASSDRVGRLVEDFRLLRRRRLIIAGGQGTGKTTLATQMMLELAGPRRQEGDPAPVLLSIASWDTGVHPRLHDWLADRLAQDYPALTSPQFGPDAPKELVERGHVLPILDGLDELPGKARTDVIKALNASLTERDQLILTTRTDELAAAVDDVGDVLAAAAVITPEPIAPEAAADYLRDCLPPRPRHDWTGVLDALRHSTAPGLVKAGSTAFGIWLVRRVYVIPAIDPAPLAGALGDDPELLRRHLLQHVISDAFAKSRWDPARARHHLTRLASYGTPHLAWWHLARQATGRVEQRRLARRIGLTAGSACGLLFYTVNVLIDLIGPLYEVGTTLVHGIPFGAGSGLGFGLMVWRSARRWFDQEPAYADLRLRGRTADLVKHMRANLANALMGGLGVGLCLGTGVGTELGPAGGAAFGLAVTVMVMGVAMLGLGIVRWAEQPACTTAAITPVSTWKADRNLTLLRIAVVVCGLTCALVTNLAVVLASGRGDAIVTALSNLQVRIRSGFGTGLASGFIAALVLTRARHHAWLVLEFTQRRLSRDGRLPRDVMAFLDYAHRRGLLRTVGPHYQFRHAELQGHLVAPSSVAEPVHV